MKTPTYQENFNLFLKFFDGLARHKHRYDVFSDFVTVSAISIYNVLHKDEEKEKEYLRIINAYSKEDIETICHLFGLVVIMSDFTPRDVLGELFMGLELGNKQNGQYFTPPEVADLMANIVHGDSLNKIDKSFITVTDPACGAGSMILSFTKLLISKGHNPAQKMWAQCIDIDRTVALMCFIQLSLWYVPAAIIVGNALNLEIREIWHTPAHSLGGWDLKLKSQPKPKRELTEGERKTIYVDQKGIATRGAQFDFGF